MKGFVPTPRATVDTLVELLFRRRQPCANDELLDPGCGTGEFVDGVIRWCERRRVAIPRITGVELDPRHLPLLRAKYKNVRAVQIRHEDFLADHGTSYDFVVGNPPYVSITALSESEKTMYRARYATAYGRFDLYLLFFEQALRNLAPGGRLVFITPEKYVYVDTAGPLRELLAQHHVEEIRFAREDTFGGLVTYPTLTVVRKAPPGTTKVRRRDGSVERLSLQAGRRSWLPLIEGSEPQPAGATLGDLCVRISCGVATGADNVFVWRAEDIDSEFEHFAHPTIAGRQLTPETTDLPRRFVMLVPYTGDGQLLPMAELAAFGKYLRQNSIRQRLLGRTCVKHKPWYAFHETPVLSQILRPKILCKDIGQVPRFWVDGTGEFVPRHSVYYIVPKRPEAIDAIASYLGTRSAHRWLERNCQRASKGFLRLQSGVLKRLPLPDEIVRAAGGIAKPVQSRLSRRQSRLAFMG